MHDGDGFDQLYKVYVSHVPTVTYVYRGDHLGTYVWMYVLRMICTNARMHVPGTRYILGMRDEYRLLWPLRPHCLALRRTFLKTLAKTSRRSFKITILRVPRTTLDLLHPLHIKQQQQQQQQQRSGRIGRGGVRERRAWCVSYFDRGFSQRGPACPSCLSSPSPSAPPPSFSSRRPQ